MRHKVYGKHLGRDKNQRTALFRSLVRSLVLSEKIETTEAKAKAIKSLVDKLITQAKSPTTKRLVSQFLTDKQISEKFINEIVPRLTSRNSGYTSTVRLGPRLGDGAMIVQMRLLLDDQPKGKKSSVLSSQSSVESQSVVGESVTDELKTGKLETENRKPKTDNRNKRSSSEK